ncbi:MAG: M20 family metallo-hydrolase [Bacteroidetes bacterium]|nr:M20 family metallo-hydrolase [Bacteroidota bacterium]
MNDRIVHLQEEAVALLRELIALPSPSREEDRTATAIAAFLQRHGVQPMRSGNNVWARSAPAGSGRPTVLLNSHHDTVRPSTGWTRDPFTPTVEGDVLYGLGSNDAGGPLVTLIAAFLALHERGDRPFDLVLAATAEEEISGANGIAALLPELGRIDMAIVGEPTGMEMAVAEKGLLVLDCTAHGVPGHAARSEGDNAIMNALPDIAWFRDFRFPKVSPTLGPVHMNVTMIEAGTQHNVVPDRCRFTVDVRCTDAYTHEEVLDVIRSHVRSDVRPRSLRLRPSAIAPDHPLVRAGQAIGLRTFGSPTLSDQALLPMPSIKLGPGRSERSHTADEFIHPSEVQDGIRRTIALLEHLSP